MTTNRSFHLSFKYTKEVLVRKCTCPLCKGFLELPKSLPCTHSFCKTCIDRYTRENEYKGTIACPVLSCKKIYPLSKIREPFGALIFLMKQFVKKEKRQRPSTVIDDLQIPSSGYRIMTSETLSVLRHLNRDDYREKAPSVEMSELKEVLNQLKRILTRGLEKQLLQGCYIDKNRKCIVVDIFSGKESEAKEFISAYLKSLNALKYIVFEEFDDLPEYVNDRGETNVEIGSLILDMKQNDIVDKYNAEPDTDKKTELLEGTPCSTLGCFAQDSSGKKYLLTAMHLISEVKGQHTGQCYLSAIINSTKTAYNISNKYKGWIGGYLLRDTSQNADAARYNDDGDVVFLDIAAFELIQDIPPGLINLCTRGENNSATPISIPTCQEEASLVQKWGGNTGLTFGTVDAMDYFLSKNNEICGGLIKIRCINKKLYDFALDKDSGSLVTDVIEFEKFKVQCPDHANSLRNVRDNNAQSAAYGLISSTRSGKGISFATQLKYGFVMFKNEFNLNLRLCNSF